MATPYFHQVSIAPRYLRPRGGYGGGGGAGGFGGLGKSLGGAIKQAQANYAKAQLQGQQDALVAQMLNTRFAPRAALVSPGVNPVTGKPNVIPRGVSTAGTTPTGWQNGQFAPAGTTAALQNAIAARRLMDEADPVGAAVRRAQAQVAASRVTGLPATGVGSRGGTTRVASGVGRGGGGGRAPAGPATAPAGKAGKQPAAPAYQPNTETNPSAYNMDKMRADFDGVYGKGAFDKVYPQLRPNLPQTGPNGEPPPGGQDKKGNLVGFTGLAQDPQKNLTYFENGIPSIHIGAQDVGDKWQGRFNTARYNAGLQPLNLVPMRGVQDAWTGKRDTQGNPIDDQGNVIKSPTGAPIGSFPVGSKMNPAMPANEWDINNVPYGQTYVDPRDGSVNIRRPLSDKQTTQQQVADLETQKRESQLASLHMGEVPGAGPADVPYDEYEDPASQARIAQLEAQRNYDTTETPGDQALIDAISARQAQQGAQPSDFYSGSPATTGVTTTGAGGPVSPSDVYAGSPAMQPGASPSPSDLYAGSAALSSASAPFSGYASYLGVPPQSQPPDVSPEASGQAAQAASVPAPTPEYVGVAPDQAVQVPGAYLGGY